MQTNGKVVGDLATHAHENAVRALVLIEIKHGFQTYLVEDESIADVIVRADGLRVAIDHKGLVDRKSTRLNSSHSQISYAVFCLKKKKKKKRIYYDDIL